MAEVEKKPAFSGLKMPEFKVGKSGMYVLEHFLMLVHVVVALVLSTSMFNHLLNYWSDQSSNGLFRAGGYETIIGLIAGTVVILPLFMYFYLRVKAAEKGDAKLLKKSWRSIWLNSFLAILFFWALGAVIALVQVLVDGLLNVGLDDGGEDLWVSVVRHLFTILLLCYVGMFFYSSAKVKKDEESRRFMVVFAGLATVLLVMTAVWPLTDQRNRRVDDLIEADLASISSSIDVYVNDESELPTELVELSLSEDIESRANKYDYEYSRTSASSFSAEYELCAVFKTDTTNDEPVEADQFNLLDLATGSTPSFQFEPGREFSSHAQGRDCFDLQSSVYNPFFSDSAQPSEDFDLNSLFESVQ